MRSIFLTIVSGFFLSANAQQFVSTGAIEFEVRTNNHKVIGDEGIWAEMFKDKIPQFTTTYYQYVFNDNKSIYKFDRYDEKSRLPRGFGMSNPEDEVWYNDYATGNFSNYRFILGDNYLLTGALMNIEWKLTPTETREIAGFNCRKATGIIFDSVYVFAFYTDEITISGGPMGISGLPGMILGITIPRMFTSYIATKLQVAGVDVRQITAPTRGKKKDLVAIRKDAEKATKDWGRFGQQALWSMSL
ncbi:MAG TPA: GLPGLI family protein [Chitinophagaceae bacterium]|nr:GLPGLI family protein [Chitinophagaceae bacterium]